MRALIIVPKDRSMTREQWKHLDRVGRSVMRATMGELKRAMRELIIYGSTNVNGRLVRETRHQAERAMAMLADPPVIALGDSSADAPNVICSPGKVFHIYRGED